MKKILSALFLACLICSEAFAVSEDMNVYVRQDVFDAKIEALRTEIQLGFQMVNTKLEAINTKFEAIDVKLEALDRRITDVENHAFNRHEDLKTMIYWGFSILGLLIAFAIFAPAFSEFLRNLRKPSITLDDVRKLIEENNAKVLMRPQV